MSIDQNCCSRVDADWVQQDCRRSLDLLAATLPLSYISLACFTLVSSVPAGINPTKWWNIHWLKLCRIFSGKLQQDCTPCLGACCCSDLGALLLAYDTRFRIKIHATFGQCRRVVSDLLQLFGGVYTVHTTQASCSRSAGLALRLQQPWHSAALQCLLHLTYLPLLLFMSLFVFGIFGNLCFGILKETLTACLLPPCTPVLIISSLFTTFCHLPSNGHWQYTHSNRSEIILNIFARTQCNTRC